MNFLQIVKFLCNLLISVKSLSKSVKFFMYEYKSRADFSDYCWLMPYLLTWFCTFFRRNIYNGVDGMFG